MSAVRLSQERRAADGKALLWILPLLLCASGSGAEQRIPALRERGVTEVLQAGGVLDRPIRGGQSHRFEVVLSPGQYFEATVRPRAIGIGVALAAPDGSEIASHETIDAGSAGETVRWIARESGTYSLVVRGQGRPTDRGRYRLETGALRPASSRDQDLVDVQSALRDSAAMSERGGDALPSALETLEQALLTAQRTTEPGLESRVLEHLGDTHYLMGHLRETRECWERALERAPADPYSQADALNSVALIEAQLGHHTRSLDFYERALALFRQVGSVVAEAVVLSNLASVSQHFGDPERARGYLERSLPLVRGRDARSEALCLHNLAEANRALGRPRTALALQRRSLELCRRTGLRAGEASGLRGLARSYASLGRPKDALAALDRSLTVYRSLGDQRGEALALDAIALTHLEAAQAERASTLYAQALPKAEESGDLGLRARVLTGLSRAALEQGHLGDARTFAEQTVELYESSRPRMVREDLSLSYWALAQSAYDLQVGALMRLHEADPAKGLDRTALEASERGRGQTLLEMLTETHVDVREGVEPELREREEELRERVNQKAQEQMRQGRRGPAAEVLEAEIDDLMAEHRSLLAEIREKSGRYAALTQPAPITVPEIQALLAEGTVLVEYDLGRERSYLWAVTRDSLESHALPGAARIEGLVRRMHERLTERNRLSASPETAQEWATRLRQADAEAAAAAAQLSKALLGPLRPHPEWHRLVIVADGALHYLPFAALPLPRSWPAVSGAGAAALLVDRYEVQGAPSAAVVAALHREAKPREGRRRVIVFADPVFDRNDERVRRRGTAVAPARRSRSNGTARRGSQTAGRVMSSGDLPRLEYTRELAESLVGRPPVAGSRQVLDFEASRATALSPDLALYRTVVFASHGLLNTERPELSGIALSLVDKDGQPQDGVLRLHDIYNLHLDADLVVLAACETGLGREIKGEGLIALSRGFLYAGARRVLASLWEVDEEATMELVRRFVTLVERDGLTHAAALRRAQREVAAEARWHSPYFWSGFVLQGEWE